MSANPNKKVLMTSCFCLLAGLSWAQNEIGDPNFFENLMANFLLITALVIFGAVLWILIYFTRSIHPIERIEAVRSPETATPPTVWEPFWQGWYRRLTALVPGGREKDILFDHEYDGIRELDNSLPPWWIALFYITIIIGVGYFAYYHVFDLGPSSEEEYAAEMEAAEREKEASLSAQANLIDENNVEAVTDPSALFVGETIFKTSCVACHGPLGEGGVGPNLTDPYWIHGNTIKDIFKVIKYGVPEKGMIAWSSQLSPADMQKVSSYILTLVGTNPPNQKEPQGEMYSDDPANQAGSPKVDSVLSMSKQ